MPERKKGKLLAKQIIAEYNQVDNQISKNVKKMIRLESDMETCDTPRECTEVKKEFTKLDNETNNLESKKMTLWNKAKSLEKAKM